MMHSIRHARHGRRLAATLAAVGALAATAVAASPAQAALTTGRCQGAAVTGQGATFPNNAHNSLWIPFTWPAFCLDVTSAPPTVGYNTDGTLTGSGAGRRTFGDRTGVNADGSQSRLFANRFAGTDEVFSTTVQNNINNGSDAVGDEGTVHTIPIAVGAVAVIANLPNGCTIFRKPDSGTDFASFTTAEQLQVSDFGTADRARLELTRTQLEGVFNGTITTWGGLVSWINDGNGTAGEGSDTACANAPIFRVVRFDSSGTTFAFKSWLNSISSANWTTFLAQNTVWPNDGVNGATKIVRGGVTAVDATGTPTAGAGANGNSNVVKSVDAVDGAIGYADLADARTASSVTPGTFERQAGTSDDKYWMSVQSKGTPGTSATDFAGPNSVADGFVDGSRNNPAKRGSNCQASSPANVPTGSDATLANWFNVTSAETGPYGGCTLTYVLAWDDYALPYRLIPGYDPVAEEKKARTVKDYLTAITSSAGQVSLSGQDYAPLPTDVRALSQAGVAAIGWDKAGDAGGGGNNNGGNTNGGNTANTNANTGGAGTTPPPAAPSNRFSAGAPRTKGTSIVLSLNVPGAGNVRVTGRAKVGKRTVQVTSGASSRTSGGPVRLTLKLSRSALAQLKKKGSLKVKLTTVYTPNGGQAASKTSSVTLKVKKAAKKRKK